MTSYFNVLMIDDQVAEAIDECSTPMEAIEAAQKESQLWIFKELLQKAKLTNCQLSLGVSRTAGLHNIHMITPEEQRRRLPQTDEALRFLREVDLLILDLAGVGPLREEWQATLQHAPGAERDELKEMNTSFAGVGFYLALQHELRSCSAVIILTSWDKGTAPPFMKKYLDPKCSDETAYPWTIKHRRQGGVEAAADVIVALYEDFSQGYWQLEQRGAIEFAASHNEPVLIVGETGTGKEYIANAIHRRWVQRMARKNRHVRDELVVVNCAALLPLLARSELFGHVRGSYTGADDHQVGAILKACGVEGVRAGKRETPQKFAREASAHMNNFQSLLTALEAYSHSHTDGDQEKAIRALRQDIIPKFYDVIRSDDYPKSMFAFIHSAERALSAAIGDFDNLKDFQTRIQSKNQHLLELKQHDIVFREEGPFGTLFLDEFGDLPPEAQMLLLRYLQSKEVQPVGYAGRILGADVRIIAATSDPRIAQFVGEPIYGSWRTEAELGRGLREDLLYRVKGQVIRAEPVNEQNARRTILDFVRRSEGPHWQDAAVTHLVKLVTAQTKAVREASEARSLNEAPKLFPSFGHRREVRRVVQLANELVRGAEERGLRGISPEVTQEVIDKIWRPSNVDPQALRRPASSAAQADAPAKPKKEWSLDDCCAVPEDPIRKGDDEYHLLEILYERMNDKKNPRATADEVIRFVNSKRTKQRTPLTKDTLRSLATRVREKLQKFQEIYKCDLEFPRGASGYCLARKEK
ncbi:MAG: sigma 54-interacting transcriptional regulator [Polyangiaceae bacterium]|nr:sigma 54-interacting transcriptional regulator [Polyangiaceae bacterium]